MGRYKENYEKIGFTCLVLFFAVLFPSKTYSASTIEINGYLKNYDTKKFSNVLKNENKELFIILNSSGGKLKTLFKTIDTIIKIKKKGVKVYTIIHDDHVAYAGAFLVILFSDIVFYKDVLNIGTFTPLSKETYKSKEKDFDRIFNIIGKNNKVSVNKVKNFFFNGDMFRPEVFKDTNIKFIGIETTKDIEFSVESYKDINFKNRASGFFKYLFTPNFIFIIFNITIILSFLSIYFTKNIILSVLSSILIAIFLFLSFEITINLKAVFAIFFTHFMLIFKEYVRFKYIIFILSFMIFILSSIFLINPLDINYYIDTGFRVSIFVILITAVLTSISYKVLILFFNKRYKKFNQNKNELKYLKASVSSIFPLKINILGDEFHAKSINKLYINDKVKVIGFKGIKIIVERL